MSNTGKVACIILNYNDWKLSKQLVEQIKEYNSIDNIVVVDNCSTDNSIEELRKIESDKVIILSNDSNSGYGSGNNLGAFYAIENLGADYLLISNPDVHFSDEFVDGLKEIFDNDKKCAIASGVQYDANGEYRWTAWPLSSEKEWMLRLLPTNEYKYTQSVHKEFHQKKASGDSLWKVDCVSGALFLVDAKKFAEVGGYDSRIFLYMEENILGIKFRQAGYNSYIALGLDYNHFVSFSIKKNADVKRQRAWLLDSTITMLKEYYQSKAITLFFYKLGFNIYTRFILICNKAKKIRE